MSIVLQFFKKKELMLQIFGLQLPWKINPFIFKRQSPIICKAKLLEENPRIRSYTWSLLPENYFFRPATCICSSSQTFWSWYLFTLLKFIQDPNKFKELFLTDIESDDFSDSNAYVGIPCPLSNFLANLLTISLSNDQNFLSEMCSLSLTVGRDALENSDAQKEILNLVIYQEKISYHISAKLFIEGQGSTNAGNCHFTFPTETILLGPQLSAHSLKIKKKEALCEHLSVLPWCGQPTILNTNLVYRKRSRINHCNRELGHGDQSRLRWALHLNYLT